MSLNSWCIEKLSGHDKVESVVDLGDSLLQITNVKGDDFIVLVKSEERSTLESVSEVDIEQLDFLLNIKKDAYIEGQLLELSSSAGFAVGGLGDIFSALNDRGISNYVSAEMSFIIRGLSQHTRVTGLERLDNRRFRIQRAGLDSVTILALNDYDFTAESVRSGIEKYGEFDAILTSNPNCRRTGNCEMAAESAGVRIFSWGELLGQLNRAW
ncbi:hypothetical protein OPW41_13180 [Vibrio europaeus]|uniref:hypothetical protein n=1 Tax=Vibrio europaeus TaxID=300876 RepID=UPI00233E60C8|nr:hypothetical protein [Vibrio europaeus]MDC5754731.1 hypothetical protein [Vibrio europaeus]MDC5776667.1 hypothetical protein [Vibrio europaeus]MDC5795784.1 hypothetical protein [Vibrio europaeus]MDC5798413.1 hypothetical protein [Vibrio europaeus]MDC5816465.1 hypothetical protein [Vibrio europaeus]